jgi:hypothetical protein
MAGPPTDLKGVGIDGLGDISTEDKKGLMDDALANIKGLNDMEGLAVDIPELDSESKEPSSDDLAAEEAKNL